MARLVIDIDLKGNPVSGDELYELFREYIKYKYDKDPFILVKSDATNTGEKIKKLFGPSRNW
jgi:phosphomannomutase